MPGHQINLPRPAACPTVTCHGYNGICRDCFATVVWCDCGYLNAEMSRDLRTYQIDSIAAGRLTEPFNREIEQLLESGDRVKCKLIPSIVCELYHQCLGDRDRIKAIVETCLDRSLGHPAEAALQMGFLYRFSDDVFAWIRNIVDRAIVKDVGKPEYGISRFVTKEIEVYGREQCHDIIEWAVRRLDYCISTRKNLSLYYATILCWDARTNYEWLRHVMENNISNHAFSYIPTALYFMAIHNMCERSWAITMLQRFIDSGRFITLTQQAAFFIEKLLESDNNSSIHGLYASKLKARLGEE